MALGAGTECPRAVGTAPSGDPANGDVRRSGAPPAGPAAELARTGGRRAAGSQQGCGRSPLGLGFQVGKGVRSWGRIPAHDPRTVSSFFPVTFACVRSVLRGSGSSPSARLLPAAPGAESGLAGSSRRRAAPRHTHPLPAQAALPFEPEAYCQGTVESYESRNVPSIVWETAPEKPRKDLWAHNDAPSFLLKNIIPGVQLLRSQTPTPVIWRTHPRHSPHST